MKKNSVALSSVAGKLRPLTLHLILSLILSVVAIQHPNSLESWDHLQIEVDPSIKAAALLLNRADTY